MENIRILQSLNVTPSDTYTNLGEAYRHINLDSALCYYNLSLELAEQSTKPEALYRALNNVGLVTEEMGIQIKL